MITLDNKKIKYVPEFSFLKKHLDLNITPSRKRYQFSIKPCKV